MLESLTSIPPDPLLKLIGEFASDKRAHKIDLGVGVYRNAAGRTDVMKAVKRAEQKLIDEQPSKAYVGMAGDVEFVDEIRQLSFGRAFKGEGCLTGLQTTGGSAALRLAGDLIYRSNPEAKLWVGLPCWSNHIPIFQAAGLKVQTYKRYDLEKAQIDFETVMASLAGAKAGDVVLLQGCCDNPTGADLSADEWKTIADLCAQRGLTPLLDIAYQGLGQSLQADVSGAAILLQRVPEAFITVSCSKNFGLYRERTGALFVLASNPLEADISRANVFSIARTNYSMPPDHGGAVVKVILQNADLRAIWQSELNEMRARISLMRMALSDILTAFDARYDFLKRQQGMFSLLPLSPAQVSALKADHAIYMAGSGRINLAGLNEKTVAEFGVALKLVLAEG